MLHQSQRRPISLQWTIPGAANILGSLLSSRNITGVIQIPKLPEERSFLSRGAWNNEPEARYAAKASWQKAHGWSFGQRKKHCFFPCLPDEGRMWAEPTNRTSPSKKPGLIIQLFQDIFKNAWHSFFHIYMLSAASSSRKCSFSVNSPHFSGICIHARNTAVSPSAIG